MVDSSNPENGVELALMGQSAIDADGSPRKSPRKNNTTRRGDGTKRHIGNNPKGGFSMDMNQEF